MRPLALVLALLALPAFAQEVGASPFGGSSPAPSASTLGAATLSGNQTFVGTNTFSAALLTAGSLRTTAGQKITFDGATEAKYLSSDGTTLTLTGLTFTAGTGGIATSAGWGVSGNGAATQGMYGVGGNLHFAVGAAQVFKWQSNGGTQWISVDSNGLTVGATGTPIADSYAAAATIDFAATTNTTLNSSAITVTGAAVGDTCTVGPPVAAMVAGASFTCYVSAADTVLVRLTAIGTSIDPASGSFNVRVFDP